MAIDRASFVTGNDPRLREIGLALLRIILGVTFGTVADDLVGLVVGLVVLAQPDYLLDCCVHVVRAARTLDRERPISRRVLSPVLASGDGGRDCRVEIGFPLFLLIWGGQDPRHASAK